MYLIKKKMMMTKIMKMNEMNKYIFIKKTDLFYFYIENIYKYYYIFRIIFNYYR